MTDLQVTKERPERSDHCVVCRVDHMRQPNARCHLTIEQSHAVVGRKGVKLLSKLQNL